MRCSFQVRIQTRGEGEELALIGAKIRLEHVLRLVERYCAGSFGQATLAQPTGATGSAARLVVSKLARYRGVVKTFVVPNPQAVAAESQSSESKGLAVRSTVYAVWRGSGAVLLAGDPEDYVAELQAEVLKRLVLRGRGQWPAKELNLLAHLESHRRFAKFLLRDFATDINTVPELASTLPPPAPLAVVAAAAVAPAGRGRGKDINQPAWKTTGDLGLAPVAGQQMAAAGPPSPSLLMGRGRGKGINQPAWKTTGDLGPAAPTMAGQQPTAAADLPRLAVAPSLPMGRGRGKDINQPAWLKTGDLGPAPLEQQPFESKGPLAAAGQKRGREGSGAVDAGAPSNKLPSRCPDGPFLSRALAPIESRSDFRHEPHVCPR